MHREKRKLWLGLWLILIPLLGVPTTWKTALIILTGIGLALAGLREFWSSLTVKRESSSGEDTYQENGISRSGGKQESHPTTSDK